MLDSLCVRIHMCVTDGAAGREGGDSSQEQTTMISIKLDDTLTHSIGFDVKHDKNVPDRISAPSSESYQRGSSVSTQNNPPDTHIHTPPPNTSLCSIFALHRNKGCVAVSRHQVYLKRKHRIFFSAPFHSSPPLLNTQPWFCFFCPWGVNYLQDKQGDVVSVSHSQTPPSQQWKQMVLPGRHEGLSSDTK